MGRIANLFGLGKPKATRHKKNKRVAPSSLPKDEVNNIPEDENRPQSKPVAQISFVKSPVMHYMATGATKRGQRSDWKIPEYDLVEIGRVIDTEAYCRQAFSKKTALMFKEGYDFVGANPKTIRYLRARLAQIARATNIPTEELLRRTGNYLISRSNAFWIKVRDAEASGGRIRTTGDDKEIEPTAGYFPAPPETMEISVDDFGKILGYRQKLPNGFIKEHKTDDVIHFHLDRKEGFLYGTPTLVPVIDDIRALRKIEQNVELLVYQYLFPLFHYKVGTETAPAGTTPDGRNEIDVVKQEIQYMPAEGAIVTPERHEIEMVGAESRALRAESYLEHFKRRVLAGLGISAVDVGEGDSSNRNTSDNMSLALIDGVKDVQAVFECQFNQHVIMELLTESTFGDEVLEENNRVFLKFREIDLEKLIKLEAHYADQFNKKAITWDELRITTGRQPIGVPEDGEDQDPQKYPGWFNTQWKLFEEPLALIKAIDESYTPLAQAAAEARATAVTGGQLEATRQLKTKEKEKELQAEKETKIAVAKAKPRPIVRRKDNFMLSKYRDLEFDIIRERDKPIYGASYIAQLIQHTSDSLIKDLESRMGVAFLSGFMPRAVQPGDMRIVYSIRESISRRANVLVSRLFRDIENQLRRTMDSNEKPHNVRAIFAALKYRTDFIANVEVQKSNNLGRALRWKLTGFDYLVDKHTSDEPCDTCLQHSGNVLELDNISLDDIAPHHASCSCELKPVAIPEEEQNQDNANIEDGAKLELCVLKVKTGLRKKNPRMSERELKSKAFAICNSALK